MQIKLIYPNIFLHFIFYRYCNNEVYTYDLYIKYEIRCKILSIISISFLIVNACFKCYNCIIFEKNNLVINTELKYMEGMGLVDDFNMQELLSRLKIVAKINGGYVTLTKRDGTRIKTYNSYGEEISELEGITYDLAKLAGETNLVQVGKSQINDEIEAWAMPMGEFVVAANNIEQYNREQQLLAAFTEALPYIAKVAEGEVVIFDNEGRRIANVDAFGEPKLDLIGTPSESARDSMRMQKPIIDRSNSRPGAMAVRVPITTKFGFGFNNEVQALREMNLNKEIRKNRFATYTLNDIIGSSEKLSIVKDTCSLIAKTDSSVFLHGETGTGKDLFAQAIHNLSPRKSKPFVSVHCSTIQDSVTESYLFGRDNESGMMEQANRGTLFLDEISNLSLDMQKKILDVLNAKEIKKDTWIKPKKIDIRIITATNRNISELVKEGKFLEELYYKINTVEIRIPPLRERKEDIPVLVHYFMTKFSGLLGKYVSKISDEAINAVLEHELSGNITELQDCIERAINKMGFEETVIELKHLPLYIVENRKSSDSSSGDNYLSLEYHVAETERRIIMSALNKAQNNKSKAAEILGISQVTLWRKLKNLNII